MATVLVAWELGAGLGHVSPLQPIVDQLVRRGHQVWLALRNVNGATMIFDPAVRVLQAPIRTEKVKRPCKQQATH